MTPRRLPLIIAAVALLVAGGCSAKRGAIAGPRPSGAAVTPTPTEEPPQPTLPPWVNNPEQDGHPGEKPGEDEHENEVGNKYSIDKPPSEDFRPPDTGESATGSGRIQLQLKIVPACVERGKVLIVVARSKPDVQVGLLSNIPKPDGKPSEIRDRTGADGLFEWRLAIPTNIGVGRYEMFGAVADDEGSDGGRSGNWFFLVADPGRC